MILHGHALADQSLNRVGDVPDVHVHARHDVISGEPEGDELAARGIASEHDAVPVVGEAGVLHADVVLIGEEVRHAVVGVHVTEHGAGGGRPLVQCIGPVLDPDPLPVERVVGTGHVARGEHAGPAGLQVLVDEDPIIHRDPGPRGKLGARLHTDSDDHEVALQFAAVAGADALDGLVSLEFRDAGAHQHLHPMAGVDVAVDGAYLEAQHALQGDLVRIDEGDLEAPLAGRGSNLGADPPGADHDDRATTVEPFAQDVGVLDAA